MDNDIMSTTDQTESISRDERCRRKHVIHYRYSAQERKRLRQQQIKDDLRGLRVPSIICLTFGILFTLGSIAMTACGYYAEEIATRDVYNSTAYVDQDLKEHLTDLKRIGPVLIGCGIFTSMCALVVVFETNGENKDDLDLSKRQKHNNESCYMEYNFGGTEEDSNASSGLKQLTTLDVHNLPQTTMQYINDTKVETETKTLLTTESITESSRSLAADETPTSRHIHNSIESQLNNYDVECHQPGVSNSRDRNPIPDKFSLLNCAASRLQPLPPLDLKSSAREASLPHRSEITRVARGSNKKKQKRIPILDNQLTEQSVQNDIVDETVKNETENDTFKLIEAKDDTGHKKGKRRSLRGSMKRKRRLTNTVQPSDNAAFEITQADGDELATRATTRSQPSSSTFSRKFSNEAWLDDSNDSERSHGKRTLNGTFHSESSLVLSNTSQKGSSTNSSNNTNSDMATSRQIRTKETHVDTSE